MTRLLGMLAAATLLAGCGDEDEPGRTATVQGGAVSVVADEYSFDPETVVVERAGPLEIRLENRGALAHNLKLFKGDREVGGTPTFQGGETRSGRVELAPGAYEMICTVGNHEELGMTGELTVR